MADDSDEDIKRIQRAKVNSVLPGLGLATGALPFLASYRSTHESSVRTTESGTEITSVTHVTRFDYIAVPCGSVAIALGLSGLVRGLLVRKYGVIALGVASMALGILQVVRGFLR